MIDTVVITIPIEQVINLNTDRFLYKGFNKNQKGYLDRGYFKATLNPTKKDLINNNYLPRVTYYARFGKKSLRVEFSAPKMLFGNNFSELEDRDFNALIDSLQDKLKYLEIIVDKHVLINTEVSAVHYSKNIILTQNLICYQVLKELEKVDYNQRLDLNQTDFRNNGYSLKLRNNSLEITFYDKLKDLQQARVTEKRAIEKDNYIQLDLFNNLKQQRQEVLRYEVRLGNKNKIRQVFKTNNIEPDLRFKAVYNNYKSKKILLHYFNIMKKGYLSILNNNHEAEEFITTLMLNHNNLSLNKVLMYYGYKQALQELGIGKFRLITDNAKGSWGRIKKDLQGLDLNNTTPNPLKYLEKELVKFEKVNYEPTKY